MGVLRLLGVIAGVGGLVDFFSGLHGFALVICTSCSGFKSACSVKRVSPDLCRVWRLLLRYTPPWELTMYDLGPASPMTTPYSQDLSLLCMCTF